MNSQYRKSRFNKKTNYHQSNSQYSFRPNTLNRALASHSLFKVAKEQESSFEGYSQRCEISFFSRLWFSGFSLDSRG